MVLLNLAILLTGTNPGVLLRQPAAVLCPWVRSTQPLIRAPNGCVNSACLAWLSQQRLALAGGGARGNRTAAANAQQKTLERSSEKLETKLAAGTASDEEQRQLLRLRLAMGDRTGAIKLLEPLSDQNPEQPSLRLLLADLKSQNDDNAGAEREIRQVLNGQPLHPQALQDYARLQLKLGRKDEVMQQLQASAEAAKGKPEALPIGLLLADVQQSNGQSAEAMATYKGLAASHPTDPRPLLALALLQHSQGQLDAARVSLQQAKLHSAPSQPECWIKWLPVGPLGGSARSRHQPMPRISRRRWLLQHQQLEFRGRRGRSCWG